MKIDLLILRLAIVFLPGIIWAGLDASYAAKVKPAQGEFVLRVFLFGLTTYVIEYLLFVALGWPFQIANLGDANAGEIINHDVLFEVIGGLLIGFVCAVLWLFAARYKLLTRALQAIGATAKFGDEDVWDYTFNSNDPAVEYIHFRDFANQTVYSGWVISFSESGAVRELVLRDVIISDFNGQELYQVPLLYLARSMEAIHIEFPYQAPNQQAE